MPETGGSEKKSLPILRIETNCIFIGEMQSTLYTFNGQPG